MMDQLLRSILARRDSLAIPLETRSLALLVTSVKLELLRQDLLDQNTRVKCVFLENSAQLDPSLLPSAQRDSSALNTKL